MSVLDTPRLTRSRLDGAVVVALEGEFDLAWAGVLRDELQSVIAADCPRVVVDLAQTTFLDSSAMGALITAGRAAAEAGGWLRLATPRENVRRLLNITQIDTVLGTFATPADAVEPD